MRNDQAAREFTPIIEGLTSGPAGEESAVGRLARAAWRAGYAVRVGCRGAFIDRIELPAAAFLAHAAGLFAAHPITAVRLTDRHPEPGSDGTGVRWAEHRAGRGSSFGGRHRRAGAGPDVPPELFAAGLARTSFATVALADAGLSAACVRHGPRLARLHPSG